MELINKTNIAEATSKLNKEPRFSEIIITINAEDVDGLGNKEITREQLVLAVGPHVTDLKVGDLVEIDVEKLFKQIAIGRDADQTQWIPSFYEVSFAEGLYAGALVSDRIVKLIIK